VRVVDFSAHDVRSQAALAASTRIMIGVEGAGLQWAVFMPAGSVLIEIAWPNNYWCFYYKRQVTKYSIRHVELHAGQVYINWTSYEKYFRRGRKVLESERILMLHRPPESSGSPDNLWKFADVSIDTEEFRSKLITLSVD